MIQCPHCGMWVDEMTACRVDATANEPEGGMSENMGPFGREATKPKGCET